MSQGCRTSSRWAETQLTVAWTEDDEGSFPSQKTQLSPGLINIVNGVAADCHRSFLDWGNVGVSGVGEYDGGVGLLHDDLQVDVSLAQHRSVVLWRHLHRHEDWAVHVSDTLVIVLVSQNININHNFTGGQTLKR